MTTLIIEAEDVLNQALIGGNVDLDKIRPFIKKTQDLYIKKELGVTLYNVIVDKFENDNLTGKYLELYENYIKNMIINMSASLFLRQAAYSVVNQGIVKNKTENGETVDKNEIDYIVQQYRSDYEDYKEQMIVYLNENEFTEFEKYKPKVKNIGGWIISDKKYKNNDFRYANGRY